MARWRPLEDYTPLAQILVRFMWEERPPLLPAQFADNVRVSRQTLSRVLNQGALPDPAALLRMARLIGVPAQQLFLAAGYTTEDDPIYTQEEAWAMVIKTMATSEISDDAERVHLIEMLQRHQLASTTTMPSDEANDAHEAQPEPSKDIHL